TFTFSEFRVGRPRPLIFIADSRACARPRRDAKNARTHTDAQVAAIAASIKEWGWTTPALVGEDGADRIGGLANLLLGSTNPRRCFSTHFLFAQAWTRG